MKVIKNILEFLRKRIIFSSMVYYLGKDNVYIGRIFFYNLIYFIENKVILNGGWNRSWKKNFYFFIVGDFGGFGDVKKDSGFFFKIFVILVILNIVM